MLFLRDNTIYTPVLKDNVPAAGRLDSLSLTNTGFTEAIDVGTFVEAMVMILTAGKTGSSPTLDCDVQYGFKDVNNQMHWIDSGDSFTQITDNGLSFKKLSANFGKYIRFRLKLGGTANPAYTVTMKLILKG